MLTFTALSKNRMISKLFDKLPKKRKYQTVYYYSHSNSDFGQTENILNFMNVA